MWMSSSSCYYLVMDQLVDDKKGLIVLKIFWRSLIFLLFCTLIMTGLTHMPPNLSFLQKLPVLSVALLLLYTSILSGVISVTSPVIDFQKRNSFLWYSTLILLAFVLLTYSVAIFTSGTFYIDYTKFF